MSIYPPPQRYTAIFNPADFETTSGTSSSTLTVSEANATYAKLAGGQTIVAQETFAGGIKTASISELADGITVTGSLSVSNLNLSNLTVVEDVDVTYGDVNINVGNCNIANNVNCEGVVRTDNIANYSGNTLSATAGNTYSHMLYLDGSTGKVGIGTNSPDYKFTVNGTAKVVNDIICSSGVVQTANITPLSMSSSSYVDIRNTATGSTVTPLRVLTANQTDTNASQLILGVDDSDAKSAFIQYVPNGFTSSASYINLGLKGYNPYITLRNARVGINNVTDPSYNLQVNGTAYVSGSLTGAGNINASGNLIASGYLRCAGIYPAASTSGPQILASAWETTSATSRTITSSALPFLGSSTSGVGTLTVLAVGTSSYGTIQYAVFKTSTGLSVTQSVKTTNLTTFSVSVASSTSLTVSTDPTSKISWIFTGGNIS